MKNLWNALEAPKSDLELRAYTSQLIGRDPRLVLHGGGNTSVKSTAVDLFGEDIDVIYVKSSGFDLAKMWTEGFTCLELHPLNKLADLSELSDTDMVRAVKRCQLEPKAANASIEAIVHGVIPYKYVDHSHADAILTLSNGSFPKEIWSELYGSDMAVLPYVKPGFDLAKQVNAFCKSGKIRDCKGFVLEHHGLFTFSDDAEEAYSNHIELVQIAEQYLLSEFGEPDVTACLPQDGIVLAATRKKIGELAGQPVVSFPACSVPPENVLDLSKLATQGTVTPEHVIHNKPFPAVIGKDFDTDLEAFSAKYQGYFERAGDPNLQRLPLNPHWGIFEDGNVRSFALNKKRARISADVANTTMNVLQFARSAGGWQGLSEAQLRDLEYWELEQTKLAAQGKPAMLAGKSALVIGGNCLAGRAIVDQLNGFGACVSTLDLGREYEFAYAEGTEQATFISDDSNERLADVAAKITNLYGGLDIVVFVRGGSQSDQGLNSIEVEGTTSFGFQQRMLNILRPYLENGFDPSIVVIQQSNDKDGAARNHQDFETSGMTFNTIDVSRENVLACGDQASELGVLDDTAEGNHQENLTYVAQVSSLAVALVNGKLSGVSGQKITI